MNIQLRSDSGIFSHQYGKGKKTFLVLKSLFLYSKISTEDDKKLTYAISVSLSPKGVKLNSSELLKLEDELTYLTTTKELKTFYHLLRLEKVFGFDLDLIGRIAVSLIAPGEPSVCVFGVELDLLHDRITHLLLYTQWTEIDVFKKGMSMHIWCGVAISINDRQHLYCLDSQGYPTVGFILDRCDVQMSLALEFGCEHLGNRMDREKLYSGAKEWITDLEINSASYITRDKFYRGDGLLQSIWRPDSTIIPVAIGLLPTETSQRIVEDKMFLGRLVEYIKNYQSILSEALNRINYMEE